jgi:hypothetical protein
MCTPAFFAAGRRCSATNAEERRGSLPTPSRRLPVRIHAESPSPGSHRRKHKVRLSSRRAFDVATREDARLTPDAPGRNRRRRRSCFSVFSLGPALRHPNPPFVPEQVAPAQRQKRRRAECRCRWSRFVMSPSYGTSISVYFASQSLVAGRSSGHEKTLHAFFASISLMTSPGYAQRSFPLTPSPPVLNKTCT